MAQKKSKKKAKKKARVTALLSVPGLIGDQLLKRLERGGVSALVESRLAEIAQTLERMDARLAAAQERHEQQKKALSKEAAELEQLLEK
ncbi:MAG: hypothetical protein AAF628_19345 [Planctomycetota bacterium]